MSVICTVVIEAAALGWEGSNKGCVSNSGILEHLPKEGTPATLELRLVEPFDRIKCGTSYRRAGDAVAESVNPDCN